MKILWLSLDISHRIAYGIFDSLLDEIKKIGNVDIIRRHIEEMPGKWQQKYGIGNMKPKSLVDIKKANEYDIIVVGVPLAFMKENWKDIKALKVVQIEDQHGVNPSYTKILKNMGFEIILSRYPNIISKHPHLKNNEIFMVPHCINDEFYNYKLKKTIETLMIGRIHPKVYPIRQKIHNELNGQSYYKRVPRPADTINKTKKWPVGKDYSKLINSAKITFTCSSIFKYPILKFMEIPGSSSALFSDYNDGLKELGFVPNKNMIQIKTKDNIKKIVKYWLNSPDELEEITQNGYNLIHTKHTAKKRAEEVLNYLESKI